MRLNHIGTPGWQVNREYELGVSRNGPAGKTTGYSVPQALAEPVRAGVAAWEQFLTWARELADLNRDALWAHWKRSARR